VACREFVTVISDYLDGVLTSDWRARVDQKSGDVVRIGIGVVVARRVWANTTSRAGQERLHAQLILVRVTQKEAQRLRRCGPTKIGLSLRALREQTVTAASSGPSC
jgi:hypothetical protein